MKGRFGFWRADGALRQAAERYPVAFAAGAVLSVAVWWVKKYSWKLGEMEFAALGLEALLAGALSVLAGTAAAWRGWGRGWRWGLQAAVAAAFAARVALGWGPEALDEYGTVSRLALAGSALAALAWVLGARAGRAAEGPQRLAVGTAVGGAAALGLSLGVGMVAWGLDTFFDWGDSSEFFVRFAMGPTLAAGGLTALAWAASEEPFELPTAWRALLKWVAVPVHAVFTGVLLAYFAGCTARWDLPNGEIAMFATVAGLGWVVLNLLGMGEKGFAGGYARWGGLAVLPLAALQVVALGMRVGQYGLSPVRCGGYAVAAFTAVFAVGAAVRPRTWARWGLWWMVLVALAAGASPWSAVDTGIGVQVRRLEGFRARREAGERFERETRAAIMGAWDMAVSHERRGGHWRKREGFSTSAQVEAFRKEWGFEWQWRWKRMQEDDDGQWIGFGNNWEELACPPASTIRKGRLQAENGRIVVRLKDGTEDLGDVTDAVLAAAGRGPQPIMDLGGGWWFLLESGSAHYRREFDGTRYVKHCNGCGWVFLAEDAGSVAGEEE